MNISGLLKDSPRLAREQKLKELLLRGKNQRLISRLKIRCDHVKLRFPPGCLIHLIHAGLKCEAMRRRQADLDLEQTTAHCQQSARLLNNHSAIRHICKNKCTQALRKLSANAHHTSHSLRHITPARLSTGPLLQVWIARGVLCHRDRAAQWCHLGQFRPKVAPVEQQGPAGALPFL